MRLALTISALALAACSMAQTPGHIFRTAVNDSLLDPNGDGWISQTTSGFSDIPTITDESEEFETDWNVLWHFEAEPSSDLQTGSTCGPTEIVDNPNTNEHAAYWKIHDPDGVAGNDDELLMFRMRINQDPNNAAYGYSFLIDSDQQFGITGSNVDPNAMAGNPGFEYEILFASGNSGGVYVNDVDGVAQHNQITNLKTYNDGVNDQRAYARFSNCTGTTDPIFIDFFIAFADLGSAVTSNSTLRMVFASASSANSALNGSASDVGGIADSDYPDDDSMFETYVAAVPTIQFSTGYSIVDVDNDGVDDATDNCVDLAACNYDGSVNNVACQYNDACGVCGGSGVDVDADGVCDDVDNCTNTSACNYDGSVSNVACLLPTTWYFDGDTDGFGDASNSTTACTQPSGYVSNSTDCDDTNGSVNALDACGVCGGDDSTCSDCAGVPNGTATVDACGVCGGDNSTCSDCAGVPNGTATVDACGVCGGDDSTCSDCAGVPNGTATVDAIGVCGGTCTTDSDSDGVCDDGGADWCTDNTATNYTANPTAACIFPAPATAVSDTIMGCVDQTDAVALDLDTLHTGTGTWNYTISQDVTGTYAAATLTGSVLSVDFSAAGQDSSTVELTGTNGTDNIAFNILVVEGTYPFVTSSAPDGGNQPTSPTGGVGMTFDGGYGVPLMVHYYEDAVYALAPDGSSSWHAHGEELTAMTDSSGSLITLPAGDYFITGYTNHWGCYNPEPATSGTPTANPSYRLITVSHLLPD